MTGKELYQIWAPTEHEKWTRFAKPALFVHANESSILSTPAINLPSMPVRLSMLEKEGTAIIVDLPGATGVESGLALARHGYIPIPLYNGIHEKNIGDLEAVVDNAPIVEALQAGANVLKNARLMQDVAGCSPAFLLDYNRDKTPERLGMYDNRWSIDMDDMPEAQYMIDNGINHIVLWTEGKPSPDLAPILDSYQDMGINIFVFTGGQKIPYVAQPQAAPVQETPQTPEIPMETQLQIEKFENGRVALMLLAGMALVNLFFQFFVWAEPLLWTTPSIQWITYLWLPEIVGDIIAVAVVAVYVACYFMSGRRRWLLTAAWAFFAFDVGVLFVYVLIYGVASYTGYSFIYGVLVFGFPIVCLYFLFRGSTAERQLQNFSEEEYYANLDTMDEKYTIENDSVFTPRRRFFRGFRGYQGYGGSGRGGYRGSGYRGFGGGYGGGFGG